MNKPFFTIILLLTIKLGVAQHIEKKIHLDKQNYTLATLFNEITKKSGYEFSYTNELNTNQTVTIKNSNTSVKNLLRQAINTYNFKITSKNKKLIISAIAPENRKYRISGHITDSETGETLINATITNKKNYSGTISNNFGFYSLSVKNSRHNLLFSYVGYQPKELTLNLTKDTIINISLQPKVLINEVIVTADSTNNNINHLFVSSTTISKQQLNKTGFLSNSDLFQSLLKIPGVQSGNEGIGGLSIRSGSPEQNLILLDDIPIYYASHTLGLFSIFNSDAINYAKMIKGGFPARYGGRASSVIDIKMKDGNRNKLSGSIEVGLLTSKFNINGPLNKGKTTFNISLRRSYVDLISGIFINDKNDKANYFFGDLNTKITHRFSPKNRLFFSIYWGGDLTNLKENNSLFNEQNNSKLKFGWGNFTSSLRWNHIYNNHLFSNTSLIYSRYTFISSSSNNHKIDNKTINWYNYDFKSGIRDFQVKTEFDYIPNSRYYLKFGLNTIHHNIKSGNEYFATSDNSQDKKDNNNINSDELDLFGECQIQVNPKLLINAGLRWSTFWVRETFYSTIEPRLNLQYKLTSNWLINGSFSKMTQYLHLVSRNSIMLPTDIWLPVTDKIRPLKAFQYTLGMQYKLGNNYTINTEIFYKKQRNTITFNDEALFKRRNTTWENVVEAGTFYSKGWEFSVRKSGGKLTGDLNYTLATAKVQFPIINNGNKFVSSHDRPHNIGINLNYNINKKVKFSTSWHYGSGTPTTLANTIIKTQSPYINSYTSTPTYRKRNNYRMPAYHRLDLAINFTKKKRKGVRIWSIGIYNAYNRKNTSFIYTSNKKENHTLKKVHLFPIIPHITYTYKF